MTYAAALQDIIARRVATRLAARDSLVFAPADAAEVHASVRTRLGWLDAPRTMRSEVPMVRSVAADAIRDGLTDVYLLGMGGSSLCAEVLRDIAAPRHEAARLTVLDTTDERTIREVTDRLDPSRALFVVASKSGSTVEVTSLERHFWSVMAGALADRAGSHFVAITDPQTGLAAQAAAQRYRHTFINPADIGGRYSALSLFGLVPAALIGRNLEALLEAASQMADRCVTDEDGNPGAALGTFMGSHAQAGRDKLTLIISPVLAPLGPWIEQLVAESTGKQGRGVLPIVDEPAATANEYGRDRAFVIVTADRGDDVARIGRELQAAGQPVFTIDTSPADLGGEFFRWEFATAIAGAVLGVNPFDEPNVRDAKTRTQRQLDHRARSGAFDIDPPLTDVTPVTARREHRGIGVIPDAPYVAILDYLPSDAARPEAIARLRATIRRRTGGATTYGVGPRYLHSTGQYHKGGPNSGRFILLTGADRTTTHVPGTEYTFSVLKQAQALGDFDALVAAGRDVVHYHLNDASADASAWLETIAFDLG